MGKDFVTFHNCSAVALQDIPLHGMENFTAVLKNAIESEECRVSAFFAEDNKLFAVLLDKKQRCFRAAAAEVGSSYPALTNSITALHWFEREIFEENNITPLGHPWLKPIRFSKKEAIPGSTGYFTMQGSAAHEVAVGPVHAGVIEPGHFRFQCMGEDVYSLEISLGYQHRGIEKMLIEAPAKLRSHLIETASGDSSIAYALGYDGVMTALAGIPRELSERTQVLRTLALELERIANHVGDIGAHSGDVAYLTTNAYCGRIRGDFLNMTAQLCGNRFGRNYINYGGVAFDLPVSELAALREWFEKTVADFKNAWEIMADDPGVLDRFEGTGTVPGELLQSIGAVGVAARAGGLEIDARHDLGYIGVYDKLGWHIAVKRKGDVIARAKVRRRELRESIRMVRALFSWLENAGSSAGAYQDYPVELQSNMLAVSAVEAWRGEMVCVGISGNDGKLKRMKLVDPSFHNWFALAMALRGEQISNFPICNKSFNLSYCGHDL